MAWTSQELTSPTNVLQALIVSRPTRSSTLRLVFGSQSTSEVNLLLLPGTRGAGGTTRDGAFLAIES